MKYLIFAFIILISGFTFSCNSSKNTVKTDQSEPASCQSMRLLTTSLDSVRKDYFQIDSIGINNDCLEVFVNYGGGCGDAEFEMYYTQLVLNSMPPQTSLTLGFTDKDHCRAIIHKKLSFDLEPFNQNSKTGGIWLTVNSKEHKILYTN